MYDQSKSNHNVFIASKITYKLRYVYQLMKKAIFRWNNTKMYKKKGRDKKKEFSFLQKQITICDR
jgi:hypothetical protein